MQSHLDDRVHLVSKGFVLNKFKNKLASNAAYFRELSPLIC
jgi:hypothetical protein